LTADPFDGLRGEFAISQMSHRIRVIVPSKRQSGESIVSIHVSNGTSTPGGQLI